MLHTPSSARTEANPELRLDNPGSADSMAGDALKKCRQFPQAAAAAAEAASTAGIERRVIDRAVSKNHRRLASTRNIPRRR
jgi:hypothetical protein